MDATVHTSFFGFVRRAVFGLLADKPQALATTTKPANLGATMAHELFKQQIGAVSRLGPRPQWQRTR